jgi:hypothetical protein
MRPKVPQSEFDAKLAVVSDIDWARLAAYVDGEGTIMIAKSVTKTCRKHPNYVLTLIVANTDPRLICWLSDTFTGYSTFSHSAGSRLSIEKGVVKRKVCFSWRQYEERAAEIIRHIIPYLIMKREQAEIALAYREIRKAGSKGRRLNAGDLEVREELRQKMRSLNSGDWERQETK